MAFPMFALNLMLTALSSGGSKKSHYWICTSKQGVKFSKFLLRLYIAMRPHTQAIKCVC
jgi:hypothetical protein